MQSVPSVSRQKLGNKRHLPTIIIDVIITHLVASFNYYLDVNDSNFTCRELDLEFAAMSSGRRDSVPFQLHSPRCAQGLCCRI